MRIVVAAARIRSVAALPRVAAPLLRGQSRFFGKTVQEPAPVNSEPLVVDEQLLSIVMQVGQWKRNEGGLLFKSYEFRDEKTANKFEMRGAYFCPLFGRLR